MKLIALKDVCKINMGQSPNSSSYNDYGDGMPFFQGNADFGERYPITRVWCNTPTKIAQAEDILISVRAPIGALNYAKEECCIGRGLAAITPDRNKVSQDFIYWALKGKKAELNDKGNGSTFKAISRKILEETMIPDINFEQQHKCAENLEKIYGIIQNRRKELLALDDLIKARFVEMFGDLANPECSWDKCKFVDACADKDDIKCGPFGTQLSKDEYTTSGIAVWEIPQINTAFLSEPTHFLTEEKAEQLNSYTIIPGDIAMSRKGNVGKCALFPNDYPDGIIHSDVLRIRVDRERLNPAFMVCQLHFSGFVTRQIELVSSGAIMAGVNVTKLKQIYVHVPPMDLQNQFADFVRQVDKSKLMFQKLHQKLNILRQKAGNI